MLYYFSLLLYLSLFLSSLPPFFPSLPSFLPPPLFSSLSLTFIQIVHAAQTLCAHSENRLAQKNMVLFREAWNKISLLLQYSMEALVPVVDFMTVAGIYSFPFKDTRSLYVYIHVYNYVYVCVLCAELRVREDSQKFIQALESGNSRWMRRTLQIVQSRCLQLLRVVQEDVVGRPEAYSHGQLSRIDNTAQSLREKCEENVCVSGFFHSLSLSL